MVGIGMLMVLLSGAVHLASLSASPQSIHPRYPSLPPMLLGRPPGGFKHTAHHLYTIQKSSEREDKDDYPYLVRGNFSQKFDHFDPLDDKRWNQRFWYNPKYYNPEKVGDGRDLIFLMIGGEAAETDRWAASPKVQYIQWAAKYGAAVFDLEHRFFGPSRPINDMRTSSLRYLTTEQALADIAYFITEKNKEHGFKNPKWISFGGSYPGSLSAWFRSKYPELTVGAVASSAPLHLKLDFFEYATVMENTITATNPLCATKVKEAFDMMQNLTTSVQGRETLNQVFHLDPPFDDKTMKKDINNFFANVYNIFQGMIQYTYDGANESTEDSLTAKKLCEVVGQSDDLVNNVYQLYLWYSKFFPPAGNVTQFANRYQDVVDSLDQTDYSKMDEDVASYRGWTWLCCNELGFMQTTDGGRGIFGSVLPINYFYDLCTDLFGDAVKAEYVRDQNRAASRYYGGEAYFEATNLILPNGLFDPWHILGYYPSTPLENNVVSVPIAGAAHCSDMYPSYEGEPEALSEARASIEEWLKNFIYGESPNSPGTGGTSQQTISQIDAKTSSMIPNSTTPHSVMATTQSSSSSGILLLITCLFLCITGY